MQSERSHGNDCHYFAVRWVIPQKAVAGLSRLVERGWLELQMDAKCCVYCVSQYWRQSGESKPSAGEMRLRRGGPLGLAPCPLCMHWFLPLVFLSGPPCLCVTHLVPDSVVWTGPEVRGHSWRVRRGDGREPLNLMHSIICSVSFLSHWELLNTLDGNASVSDRHKYQR